MRLKTNGCSECNGTRQRTGEKQNSAICYSIHKIKEMNAEVSVKDGHKDPDKM